MKQFAQVPQFRITVNSRCGRACFYCRPSGEAVRTAPAEELTTDNVVDICHVAASFGVQEMKLTGGDPALWAPLVGCVTRLKSELPSTQVHVISRHPSIGSLAPLLAAAGVDLINISLDTLDPVRHRQITGKDDLMPLIKAIQACVATGIPCKINTVVMKGINDDELDNIIAFCERIGVSTLKLLDLIRDLEQGAESYAPRITLLYGYPPRNLYMPLAGIADRLKARAISVRTLVQGRLGHPMAAMRLPSGLEVVVKDKDAGAWYGTICKNCQHYPCHDALMALRLTADLRLQFCLLRDDLTIDLKPILAIGRDAVRAAIEQALTVYDNATFHQQSSVPIASDISVKKLSVPLPILGVNGGLS